MDNVYKMILILAKRSNQISAHFKDELNRKLQEFVSLSDNLEEVLENKEQIEISRFYERLPKPTSISVEEYKEDKIYYRIPTSEEKLMQEEEHNQDHNNVK